MKRIIPLVFLVLPLFVAAQKDSLSSGVFKLKESMKDGRERASTILFEGSTHTMEWLQVSVKIMDFIKANKKVNNEIPLNVPPNEEHLLIIKSGIMRVRTKHTSQLVSAGSIVLIMPGERCTITGSSKNTCSYYLFSYRSKQPVDTARGNASGGSIIKDWNAIEFKQNEKGGRRNFFERPTAMFKRIEAHVTTLKGGLISHAPHTHIPAEFALVLEGKTEMEIGGKVYKGSQGDLYYVTSGILHGIKNAGTENCSYFAIQFE